MAAFGSQFLRFGVPMITLIVAGSFALKEFTEIKIKRRDEKSHALNKEEALQALPHKGKQETLEEVYEDITKKLDIDHWENKRGPRPWEQ
ncbi:PREDICTED: cytochrome c oxidase assembly protein COX16 homolog, mitochondrial-like [Acropora digitifera]|uniref:cytochrome c oxidase assembly protein COX16 homolog, mitochondrial-like n=1 Tax=Acropora digitifera TaxID=70779 RepID=UPI00077AC4CC|nr:PREDICTED: cytochrome c oxidase assembly protein COX16 homolog, mitochondrial-like [Acropora digitifera]